MAEQDEPKILWDGPHIRVMRRGKWDYAARKAISGIVGIAAVTEDRKLLLVEQYRPPVNANVIELPAGLAGDGPGQAGETLLVAAQRELLEETGYRAEHWLMAAEGTASAGITDEVIALFVARRLTKISEQFGDGSESLVLHEVPLVGIEEWLAVQRNRGKLIDLKVYVGLYFANQPDK